MNAGFVAQVDTSSMTVKFASIVFGGIGPYPVRKFPEIILMVIFC